MPRVFVLNKGMHDYSKAERFGELIYVTEGRMPIFKTDYLKYLIKEVIKDFKGDDYLMLTGSPIMTALAIIYLKERFDNVNIMMYEARRQDYTVRTI